LAERDRAKDDLDMEMMMGNLLRTGVLVSAALVLLGGINFLIKYGPQPPHYQRFRLESDDLRTVGGTVNFALIGHSRGYIQLGILLLIATPVTRVIFSVFAFIRERDWMYVGITLIVVAVLAYSLIWGKG